LSKVAALTSQASQLPAAISVLSVSSNGSAATTTTGFSVSPGTAVNPRALAFASTSANSEATGAVTPQLQLPAWFRPAAALNAQAAPVHVMHEPVKRDLQVEDSPSLDPDNSDFVIIETSPPPPLSLSLDFSQRPPDSISIFLMSNQISCRGVFIVVFVFTIFPSILIANSY
jgi:hypothetical protein